MASEVILARESSVNPINALSSSTKNRDGRLPVSEWGREGIYEIYRSGNLTQSATGGFFFSATQEEANKYSDTMVTEDGRTILRTVGRYTIYVKNPLVVDSETEQGCTAKAYNALVGGKGPESQLAKDKRIMSALNKSNYDSIVYKVKGKPLELVVPPKSASSVKLEKYYNPKVWERRGVKNKEEALMEASQIKDAKYRAMIEASIKQEDQEQRRYDLWRRGHPNL